MSPASENPLADAGIREKIHHELDRNLMVEAAAGTGKTTSMVRRMVNLIASGVCRIENLAAVTFTRKAAAELRERFHTRLRDEIRSDRTEAEKKNIEAAISKIESAFIGTYHSFCSLLLRERPVECNVDPEFREIDDREEFRLKEQSWRMFLDDLYAGNDPRRAKIEELGLELADLKTCFEKFTGFLDVDRWPHDRPVPIDLVSVKTTVDEYIELVRRLAPSFPTERGTDEMMNRLEKILLARDNADWQQDADFFRVAQLFKTTSLKPVQKWWIEKQLAKTQQILFHELRQNTIEPALNWWYQRRYRFVIELMLAAREIYERFRRASGGLDFQDLLSQVAAALKDQPHLRAYYQKRFTHLLVDEFQDTDPIQAEVVAFLTSENREETVWQNCIPRPGSLFVVGDPKQSIYRFRRADIVTYLQVRGLFEKSDGEVLTLSTNFRSADSVRTWNNSVFGRLLGDLSTPYSPEPVAMEAGRQDGVEGDFVGVFRLPIPGDYRQAEAVAFEAEQIAKYTSHAINTGQKISRTREQVQRGVTAGAEAGDFLIIARNKRHLQAYAEALDRYGVPNEIAGGNAFERIEELRLLSQLLKAIDDPKNGVSYVALLRGPLFGFGDADLYKLKKCKGSFSWLAPLPESLPEKLANRFGVVKDQLGRYRKLLRTLPYPAALIRIVDDIGLLARSTAQAEGDIVAGGFLKAIEWLRSRSWDFDSTHDLITELDEMIEDSETDSCSVNPRAGSRVRIMNLHKAKGLEAPVVFLANTYGRRTPDPDCHVDRSGENSCGYLAIEQETGSGYRKKRTPVAVPSNWEEVRGEEVRFEEAEETRLLYVACTRAESQLIISEASGNRYSFWSPLYTFLDGNEDLSVPDDSFPVASNAVSDELPGLAETTSQIEADWHQIASPTYAIIATKSDAIEKAHVRPAWTTSGEYGLQWGSALHRLFELLWKRPGIKQRLAAQRIVDAYDLGHHRLDEIVEAASSLVESDLWKRVQKSDNVYTEIPFDVPDSGSEIPAIRRGVIDLCFREGDGWVVVDYKTDDIQSKDLKSAVELYRPQVEAYTRLWEEITGEKVRETGIYFTRVKQYSTV